MARKRTASKEASRSAAPVLGDVGETESALPNEEKPHLASSTNDGHLVATHGRSTRRIPPPAKRIQALVLDNVLADGVTDEGRMRREWAGGQRGHFLPRDVADSPLCFDTSTDRIE